MKVKNCRSCLLLMMIMRSTHNNPAEEEMIRDGEKYERKKKKPFYMVFLWKNKIVKLLLVGDYHHHHHHHQVVDINQKLAVLDHFYQPKNVIKRTNEEDNHGVGVCVFTWDLFRSRSNMKRNQLPCWTGVGDMMRSREVLQREANRAQLAVCPPPSPLKKIVSFPFLFFFFFQIDWEVDRMPINSVRNTLSNPHEKPKNNLCPRLFSTIETPTQHRQTNKNSYEEG
ncbi:hypothetical protein ACOSQ3_011455 [Xanthoceras sorbifolium]